MIYSDVLSAVYRELAKGWNIAVGDEDAVRFATSIKDWPAFEDSAPALRYLKPH